MARKRINAPIYTRGRYGRGWWDTVDTDNDFLYSWCRYPTKITEADLPEDYIKIRSRVTRYLTSYLKTSGIVDMAYRPVKFNHMFKDDYLYISYEEPLRLEKSGLGFEDCVNYDICVCGNDIVDVVLAAEKYSGFDTSKVRAAIEKKRVWLRDNHPWDYERIVGEDRDIFEIEAKGRSTPEQTAVSFGGCASDTQER